MLAKLIDGVLQCAPRKIYIENQLVYNPSEDQLKEHGYKEVEETDAPIVQIKTQQAVMTYNEREDKIVQTWNLQSIQPDPNDALKNIQRQVIIDQLKENDDKTLGVACMALFDVWTKGNYIEGDVRTDPKTGYPYECVTSHDSISNPEWTIDNRTLWKPWHSRSLEYALPYEAPTGAHDVYKNGEYVIYENKIYKCIQDTNFSPVEYPQAWEVQ